MTTSLIETDELLRILAEYSQVGVIVVEDGVFTYVNPKAAELLGSTPHEIIGKKGPKDFVHPGEWPKMQEDIRGLVMGDPSFANYSFRAVRKDGSSFDAEMFGSLVSRDGAERVIAGVIDVTEPKRMEQALIESEERYRSLLDLAPVAIVVHSEGKIILINRAGMDLLGASDPSELVGRAVSDFLPPEIRETVARGQRRLARTKEPVPPHERRVIRLDGTMIDTEVAVAPITYQGKTVGQTVIRDVTARKRAEKALKESEERFRAMCEDFPIGLGISRAGRVVYANKTYLEMFGYEHLSEIDGRPIVDYIAPECRADVVRRAKERAAGKEIPAVHEITGIRKDGSRFPFAVRLSRMALPDGMADFGFFTDTSERKVLKDTLGDALRELESLRRRMEDLAEKTIDAREKERLYLASEIHDDFLQGLGSISYFLHTIDLSSLDEQTQETRKRLVETVNASLKRGRSLIGEIRPLHEPKSLTEAIRQSIGITFEGAVTHVELLDCVDIPEMKPAVKTNILRIVQEALINARKHSRAKNVTIDIKTVDAGSLSIEVRDDGDGFDPTKLSRSELDRYGLLTMEHRATLMGGELQVKSAPGKGTTVKATFPMRGDG